MSREVKVGAFVFLGLLLTGMVVFLIGETRRMFEGHTEYNIVFEDIQGLKRGSPVRMGGLDIGTVQQVAFPEDAANSEIHVTVSVVTSEARRIREDSVASIKGKGLLGDKLVDITPGTAGKKALEPFATIPSKPAQDPTEMLVDVASAAQKADSMLGHLEKTSETLSNDQFREDLSSSASSLRNVLDSLAHGEGYASRLIHDPGESESISRAIQNLERNSKHLERILIGLDTAVKRVNNGPGLAHELIYGESGAQAVAQLGGAAEEVAQTLRGVREGDGLAHSLLYGSEGSNQIVADLNSASSDLKAVMQGLREGKGTLGALLVDPSVYEDVKVLLGNIQRNRTLRALVRYSIKQDEREGVEVSDPRAAEGGSPPVESSAAR